MGRTNNDDQLAQALDVVLARLESGEDLAACLAAYPDLAEELSCLVETRKRLNSPLWAPELPKEALEARRRQFLAAAQAYRVMPVRRSLWQRVQSWRGRYSIQSIPRPILLAARAVVVLALVTLGLLGMSDVAQASMPDSAFYPLKLEIEDVRLGLTFDPRAQTELAMSFVVERADELEHLAAQRRQVPVALQEQLVEELNIALSGAARVNAHETVQVLTQLNQVAEAQRLRLAQITQRSTAADPQAALQVAQQILAQAHRQAQAGLENPEAFQHRVSVLASPLISPTETQEPTQTPVTLPETATATPRPTHTPVSTRNPSTATPVPSATAQPVVLTATPEIEPTPRSHGTPTPVVPPTAVPVASTEATRVKGKPTAQPTTAVEPTAKPTDKPQPTDKPEPTARPTHEPNQEPTPKAEIKPTHQPDPKPTKEKGKDG